MTDTPLETFAASDRPLGPPRLQWGVALKALRRLLKGLARAAGAAVNLKVGRDDG